MTKVKQQMSQMHIQPNKKRISSKSNKNGSSLPEPLTSPKNFQQKEKKKSQILINYRWLLMPPKTMGIMPSSIPLYAHMSISNK